MIGVDGGNGSGLMSVLNRIFQCSHRRQSRPITPRGGGQTYAVCLDCGTRLAYDLSAMRAEASVLGITLDRRTSEIGTEDIFDISEPAFIPPPSGGRTRMSEGSRPFHRDFGTIAVLCIGAMSLAGGLLYLPNRPAGPKRVTIETRARALVETEVVESSPNLPAQEDGTKGMPASQETEPPNPTVSTEPVSTTGGKAIEPESISLLVPPRSNSGRARSDGNGSVIVLAREAVAALELSQHPERLSRLIRKGALFTVPRGTAIKLVQGNRLGNRLVIKVLIMNGSKVGQKGWAKSWPVSP